MADLMEHAIRNGEGRLGPDGQIVVDTGKHRGRSPRDKFFVKEPGSETHIDWEMNKPIGADTFDALLGRVGDYLAGKEIYALDCYIGADPRYRLPVRVLTTYAWQSLFAQDLFIRRTSETDDFKPEFTVLDASLFEGDAERDGLRTSTFCLVNFARKMVLIGGTRYAGEIKKSVFTLMNYLMPLRDVMPMHCSANVGPQGDVAIFFGLSGTGKTTLSSDPNRPLIGDDEHGWSADGVFNFEGGCYAKTIRLSQKAEPEIWSAAHRFGTVLENVVMNPATHALDLDSEALTENTRAAYPVEFIPNIVPELMAGHPNTIVMLTADAFGVLPPISKMTPAQAMYHFLSGYTAKVAGTESGVNRPRRSRPASASRSWCIIPRSTQSCSANASPSTTCSAGSSTRAGPAARPPAAPRMKIAYTRAMVNAAVEGRLKRRFHRERAVLRPRDPDVGSGRARRRTRSAQGLERSRRLRCPGEETRRTVRREFQAVRSGRYARRARRFDQALTVRSEGW